MSDVAAALIALDASLEILGPEGERQIAVSDFFSGDALAVNTLGPAEIVRSVTLPPAPPRFGWGYHKTGLRGGLEFGMAVIATTLQMADGGKTCANAKIVFSAVGQSPLRPAETEQAMAGAEMNAETVANFAKRAAQEIDPLPHHGFTIRYLRENIEVHLRRALARAVERANKEQEK
jgi:CO/xanthine dehydrogenase FAD-binding subunit